MRTKFTVYQHSTLATMLSIMSAIFFLTGGVILMQREFSVAVPLILIGLGLSFLADDIAIKKEKRLQLKKSIRNGSK